MQIHRHDERREVSLLHCCSMCATKRMDDWIASTNFLMISLPAKLRRRHTSDCQGVQGRCVLSCLSVCLTVLTRRWGSRGGRTATRNDSLTYEWNLQIRGSMHAQFPLCHPTPLFQSLSFTSRSLLHEDERHVVSQSPHANHMEINWCRAGETEQRQRQR